MYRPTPPFIAVVVAALALAAFASYADDTVSWVHPTQYTDNTAMPLSDIASSVVRYGNGTTANPPTTVTAISVPAPAKTVVVPRDPLLAGTVCYQVATVSTPTSPGAGSQSAYGPSAWVCKTQSAPAPKKPKIPSNVQVQ